MKPRTILALSATALTLFAGLVTAQSKPATGFENRFAPPTNWCPAEPPCSSR